MGKAGEWQGMRYFTQLKAIPDILWIGRCRSVGVVIGMLIGWGLGAGYCRSSDLSPRSMASHAFFMSSFPKIEHLKNIDRVSSGGSVHAKNRVEHAKLYTYKVSKVGVLIPRFSGFRTFRNLVPQVYPSP